MDSKIKVGSFIQLPTNSFIRSSSKKKSIKQQKLTKNNSSIQSRSSIETNSINKLNSSDHKKSNFEQSIKLTNEEKERQLNEFVDKIKSAFNKELIKLKYKKRIVNEQIEKEICPVMPPFELFIQVDTNTRIRKLFNYLEEDDYLIGHLIEITKTNSDTKKARFKLICFDNSKKRLIHDLNLYAFYLIDQDDSNPIVNDLNSRNENNYFRFKLLKIVKDQIFVTFDHSSDDNNLFLNLGLIEFDDLPEHFKKVIDLKKQEMTKFNFDKNKDENANDLIYNFDKLLHLDKQFKNPNSTEYLLVNLQIDCDEQNFKDKLVDNESNLSKSTQMNKDLKLGIECLKLEQYEKAEYHLNKAISLEPNADAYTAKGCLFANQSKLSESIKEFEQALKLNDKHINAKKYLIEVLKIKGKELFTKEDYLNSLDVFKKILVYDEQNEEILKKVQLIEDKLKIESDKKRSLSSTDLTKRKKKN